jgi:hypothetical protein
MMVRNGCLWLPPRMLAGLASHQPDCRPRALLASARTPGLDRLAFRLDARW